MEQAPKKELGEKELNDAIYKAQLVIDRITNGKTFKNQEELDRLMEGDYLIQQKQKEIEEYKEKLKILKKD
jgi:hypothetical protein